ncbi:MAG: hypothetical protein AAB305_04700 [Candidatus Zixiibacteriota bacterium]
MNYFEAKERLESLVQFRKQYGEYIAFTNRERNLAAQTVRERLESALGFVCDSLGKVSCGYLQTTDLPSQGGKSLKINVVKAVFRPELVRKYDLRDDTPLAELDRGISIYQKMLWREKLNLWNPLFWFVYLTSYAARLPFRILESAGQDVAALEKTPLTRGYVVIVQLIFAFLILKQSGFLTLIWFDFASR